MHGLLLRPFSILHSVSEADYLRAIRGQGLSMALSFACALGHAPGIVAWREAAPAEQRERLYQAFGELRARLEAARLEALVLFTAEHWANFFLDHISPVLHRPGCRNSQVPSSPGSRSRKRP